MASGQVAEKKEAPSRQAENEEDLEAALDAPVQEDAILEEAERDTESLRTRNHRQASASEGSQQDTLAEVESHRGGSGKDIASKK